MGELAGYFVIKALINTRSLFSSSESIGYLVSFFTSTAGGVGSLQKIRSLLMPSEVG